MTKTLRIMNNNSGFVFDAAQDDSNGLRLSGHFYRPDEQQFVLQPEQSSGKTCYRIVNKARGTFVHGDDDGTGSLHMYPSTNDRCQLFELQDNGDGVFRMQNIYSKYYIHGNDDGTSSLRMYKEKNNICQLFVFFVKTDTPWA
jgi:hypothetical protein